MDFIKMEYVYWDKEHKKHIIKFTPQENMFLYFLYKNKYQSISIEELSVYIFNKPDKYSRITRLKSIVCNKLKDQIRIYTNYKNGYTLTKLGEE